MDAQPLRMVCPACNTRYEGGQFCAKDGTPLTQDANAGKDDLAGKVLADRYRIVKLLGEGGMGQVYEAHHVNINKRFAIKLLRPEIVANPEAVARFRQEAWSASSIGHENIIEIDDFATLPSGAVYLAMEYLQGQSLAERMRSGTPLELGEALEIFCQVARGLGAAHEKAIIHRDMKPENVFLAEKHDRTVVKILDFGIAKVSGAEANSLTRTGAIFGTPHYMSPEQALGKPLDHRSDIYSVGVIMYEVFTGRVPFEAESFMGILTKHITAEPKRPREVAPDRVPEDVEAAILRAMAKEPEQRYATMAELFNAILGLLTTHAPERVTPSGSQPIVSQRPPSQQVLLPTGLRPVARPTPSQPVAPQGADVGDAVPRKRSPLPIVLGIAGLLAAGGAAAFVAFKGPAADPTPPVVEAQRPVEAPKPAEPVQPQAPAEPEMVSVIVDTTPGGARIMKDGEKLGETPEAVKVPKGETLSIVLEKEGYLDEPVTVDPAKGRKLLVKLDRARAKSKLPTAALPRLPKEPVYSTPASVPPPAAPAPVISKRAPKTIDPYERLDDTPKTPKKPASSHSEVLNPY